jgi:hypothetical protein
LITRTDVGHGGRPGKLDDKGRVEVADVPTDVTHVATVRVQHPEYGTIEEEFPVPMGGPGDVSLRVTGKGMLIARVQSAKGERIAVANAWVRWGSSGAGAFMGSEAVSVLRFQIGFVGQPRDLTFGADGVDQVVVPGVRMRSDGPTLLDVTFK